MEQAAVCLCQYHHDHEQSLTPLTPSPTSIMRKPNTPEAPTPPPSLLPLPPHHPPSPIPGEEVVTKESFISICWRLIPYWLNNWEQQWGAECSSMMFELPHFAVELLVILPCVQVGLTGGAERGGGGGGGWKRKAND